MAYKILEPSLKILQELEGQTLESAHIHFTQVEKHKVYQAIYLKFNKWVKIDVGVTEAKITYLEPHSVSENDIITPITATTLIKQEFVRYRPYHTESGDKYERYDEMGIDLIFKNNTFFRVYCSFDHKWDYPFPFIDNYWDILSL
ncbi:MAG: hypothetical protein GY810_11115 [Aureispira sp.]|nr:hypothetical protein [Aureispira sp.]